MIKRLFVLDTNVLMHDPTALFRFQEHDVHLPMVVLEELDRAKKGVSEVAANVRQVSRFLDELIAGASKADIDQGIALPSLADTQPAGRVFFQTQLLPSSLPETLPGKSADHDILTMAMMLQQRQSEHTITLVSKDINLRIKAAILGIHAEDYYNDQVLDDVNLLYRGVSLMPADFWEQYGQQMESWQDSGRAFYRIHNMPNPDWSINHCIYQKDEHTSLALIVREVGPDSVLLEQLVDHRLPKHTVWGISARNQEQNFALNLLLDHSVDFVTLLGVAGTGKTLLALAAGLTQTLDHKRYREIIMTRATVPVGEDIGFFTRH